MLLGFLNKKGILDQPGKVNFLSMLCLVLNKAECDFSSLFQECNSHSVFFQCITRKRTIILKSMVHFKSLMNLQGIWSLVFFFSCSLFSDTVNAVDIHNQWTSSTDWATRGGSKSGLHQQLQRIVHSPTAQLRTWKPETYNHWGILTYQRSTSGS